MPGREVGRYLRPRPSRNAGELCFFHFVSGSFCSSPARAPPAPAVGTAPQGHLRAGWEGTALC